MNQPKQSTRPGAGNRRNELRRLSDQYELEVIDIYQQPGLAAKEQLLAVPTVIKDLPLPARRLIGNLSNSKDTLKHLGIAASEEKS